ncbi:MAG: acetylornithine/N-succinyldiaminopimelate aminotransferase [Fusobacteria bacterium]|nr:MAG: acetylornithine/N-succinyldiaminopimelate aminotransferase [Fusobacteriota bacterium]KAF0229032.1 MAG: acetylornithine/N-succinyldiaminopimelate [Fusobacteriota bacterium]
MDLMNTYKQFPYKMVKGEGNYLIDENGKKYLDLLSGIAVNPLGYGNKKIEDAIIDQVKNLIHASNYFYTEAPLKLAKLLVDNTCFDKVFFSNSGAEANEGAIKLARKYSEMKYDIDRNVIISFTNSFHGRTLATLTATGQDSFHQHFFPLPKGFKYCPFNDIDALVAMIDDSVCAIIIEPIQGEGGINIANKEFLLGLSKLAKEKDILLIFDEVQTGLGRTGNLFAYQGLGIEPDILTSAKALGGGLPLGAFMAKADVASSLVPGDHGSTFGGNPVACAGGCAVLETVLQEGFLNEMNGVAEYFSAKLMELKGKYPIIKEFRGMGLMLGLELNIEGADFVKVAYEAGLIINCTNVRVLRVLPPLTIKKEEIDILIDFLDGELKRRSD